MFLTDLILWSASVYRRAGTAPMVPFGTLAFWSAAVVVGIPAATRAATWLLDKYLGRYSDEGPNAVNRNGRGG